MANEEVVVAPFQVYRAPTGTAFPDIAAGVPNTWELVGLDGNRDFDEAGITVNRNAQDGEFRGYGAGRVRKLWTISEDLSFSFMVADFTLETMSLLFEDDQALTETDGTTTGVVRNAYVTADGANYEVGDQLEIGVAATKAVLKITKVSSTGGILAFELTEGGSAHTNGEKTQGTANVDRFVLVRVSSSGTAGSGATIQVEVYTPPATRRLILGRRGGTLVKKSFAFMLRGLGSPYVTDGVAQIEVPNGSFEGSREMTFTRQDPIKYNCVVRCIEDSGIDGYAGLVVEA